MCRKMNTFSGTALKLLLLAILLNAIDVDTSTEEELLDYYESLINAEIAKSAAYQFPKDARSYTPNNVIPKDFGKYDFVIVGGGTAGSIVASRLSEVPHWNVLLLEAGKEETEFTDIVTMSAYTSSSDYNWGFNSTPQTTCCLARNGICAFPRGRALGGTSVTNALMYTRGNKLDYDHWAAMGNPGWSYADVLPYFMKSENSKINGDAGYHGTGGYLDIEYHQPRSPKVDIFLKANEELGKPTLDYNGRHQLGASPIQLTTRNGKRLSTAKAFLEPVRNRPNLKILTESYVTKILLEGHCNKACGVVFAHKNEKYIVRAKREVILSAGVVGSAQLLMLSGVGPRGQLEALRIPMKKNLPVGRTMHDHATFNNLYFTHDDPEPTVEFRDAIRMNLKGEGPLTVVTNLQGLSYFPLRQEETTLPDVELMFVPSTKSYNLPQNKNKLSRYDVFQMSLILLRPKTTGSIRLKSGDPFEYPLISSFCLADPNNEDIENMYKAVETTVLRLLNTEAFKKLNPKIVPYEPCMSHEFLSKDYWFCVIRQTGRTAYHAGGTCPMGSDPARGAVVDCRLRVHGVSNLRVVDASVMPAPVSGHTYAAAMMIAEKAADMIKEDHRRCGK